VKIFTTLVSSALLLTTLYAKESQPYKSSLLGINIGVSNIKSETTTSSSFSSQDNLVGLMGIKIGAQTKEYRLFFNLNQYSDTSDFYDYLITYGISGQYLLHLSPSVDFFLGLEGGMASADYKLENENFSRSLSDFYLGTNIGLNIPVNEDFDIELGGKVLVLNTDDTQNNTTFTHKRISTMLVSIIYKYQMD